MTKNRLMIAAAVAALTAGSGLALAQDSKAPAAEKSAPSAQQPKAQAPAGGAMKSTTGAAENKVNETKGAAEQKAKDNKGAAAQKADDKASPNKMGQDKAQDSKSKSTSGQAPSQTQKSTTGQAPSQGQSGQGTMQQRGTEQRGTEQRGTEQRGTEQRGTEQRGTEQRGTTSQTEQRGTAGSTTNVNVNLSTEQRTRIHEVIVKNRNAPRVANVDFSLSVGTVIPRGKVKFVTVPREIVEIQPAWRGYEYFLVGDEIVIVDPRTLRIVAVIPA
jgi:hypothetical protein